MEEKIRSVKFDPGYSGCILGVSDNTDFIYSAFSASNIPLKQKKFQFSIIFPKIKKMICQNVSFYLGCLLWAVYLKNEEAGSVIENNPCLGGEFNEDVAFEETDFLLELITKQLDRDAKYYINAHYSADLRHTVVLKTYREFLKLNEGFIKAKTTGDIIIPDNIKTPDKNEIDIIKKTIDEAIKAKELTKLFEVYDFILG